jgi:hypothetical protein
MPRRLHILNGDATAAPFRRAGIPGDLTVWADVLWEGPLHAAGNAAEWRRARAEYLADAGYASLADALATAERGDAAVERWPEYDEVVLWFEHDLFDQLLLVRHLEWFGRRPLGRTILSLICIDRFPGVARFDGLGQLKPEQLATLLPSRQPVTAAQLALGTRAWSAFTGRDPIRLQTLMGQTTGTLPFLAAAIHRYLEEYPDQDGLSRTERSILEVLAEGRRSPIELFMALQRMEESVFMGDTSYWRIVRGLERGPSPLVRIDAVGGRQALPDGTVEITDAGRSVLAGTSDWVIMAGVDRWHGGVHLVGHSVPWRWDRMRARLVTSGG